METFLRFVLGQRLAVVIACALVTGLAAVSLTRARIATSMDRLLLGNSEKYRLYEERRARFPSDDVVLVGVEDPEAFSPKGQERLRRAEFTLERLPEVRSVTTVLDALEVVPGPGRWPRYVRYARSARDDPSRAAELQAALSEDPFYRGALISADGRAHVIRVSLQGKGERSMESMPALADQVERCLTEAGYPRAALHMTGNFMIRVTVWEETVFALQTLFPIVTLALLFSTFLMFRSLWPAVLASGVALLGVTWTMGFAALLDAEINILLAIVPAVVFIVAFSDVVHLCSAYRLELAAPDAEPKEALLKAGVDVGRACLFTSLTTFLGFLAMSLVPTPAFRQLGVVLGFGVAVSLLLAMTLGPVVLSLLATEARQRRLQLEEERRGLLPKLMRRVESLGVERPRVVIGCALVVMVVAALGASRLDFELTFSNRLSAEHPARAEHQWFQERLGATNFTQVYVRAPRPEDLHDPAWLKRVAAYQDHIDGLSGVEGTRSVVDVLERFEQTRGAAAGSLPPTREAIENHFRVFRLADARSLDSVVDEQAGRLAITVFVEGHRARKTAEVGDRIEALGARRLGAGNVEVLGRTYLHGQWLGNILRGQLLGLLGSIVVITLLMAIGLRSLRMGLWSMFPNLIPILATAGLMGALWGDDVDPEALTLLLLALGIGVDDTIHFLTRYRVEAARAQEGALARTFAFAGRAILMTTAILVVGFAPFVASGYSTIRAFGIMLPFCLVVALLSDLLLVPAMVRVGWLAVGGGVKAPPAGPAHPSPTAQSPG